ncbi:thioredoxin [Candidatus Kuenenbacteria bacterium]|nr:thioredoxin [Candidatus Kuenenbacteria bacterium]
MLKAMELTKDNFQKEVLESELPVLVDFYAPWCGPCQMMAPVLDQLAEEMEGKIKITKLDTNEEDNYELSEKYLVMSIPNLKVFKAGKLIYEIVGFRPKEILKAELEKLL